MCFFIVSVPEDGAQEIVKMGKIRSFLMDSLCKTTVDEILHLLTLNRCQVPSPGLSTGLLRLEP